MNKLSTLISMENLEPGAVAQIEAALAQPFMERLVIMPDCHQGYDLPIGAVALCRDVISPSYVGYDIGCGMTMVDTGQAPAELGVDTPEGCRAVLSRLVAAIPMGPGREHAAGTAPEVPLLLQSPCLPGNVQASVNAKAAAQIGTLGGGNHFIEIGKNRAGHVTVTVHSGSRKPGHSIGGWYMNQAPYLALDSDLGRGYLHDMAWALEYAKSNRVHIIIVALLCLGSPRVTTSIINENHNHAEVLESGLVLHRKGATPADAGQYGVIPLNARDGVVVTVGLGNADFLSSASHGAGRRMGRKAAERTLDPQKVAASLEGFTHNITAAMIDEAPAAYKNGEMVIEAQEGVVVRVVDRTKPLIVAKGD